MSAASAASRGSSSGLQRRLYADTLYHEHQRRMYCALHAVNNLLQRPAYDVKGFDTIIAEKLPPIEGGLFNPYKSTVPLIGYYDASVVVLALIGENIEAQQHDSRKVLTADDLTSRASFGIIVNIRSPGLFKAVVRALRLGDPRHWLSVVPLLDGTYAWLDSLDQRPEILSQTALLDRLNMLRSKDQAAIYLCSPVGAGEEEDDEGPAKSAAVVDNLVAATAAVSSAAAATASPLAEAAPAADNADPPKGSADSNMTAADRG